MVIGFQIPIGLKTDGFRPVNGSRTSIDNQDVPQGTLHIGHLRGRVLPVAAAKFMDQIITELRERFPRDLDQ